MSTDFLIDPDHPITKLDPARPKHWMIARLIAHGVCDERIAQHVDISEFAIKKYRRDPRTQAMIEHLDEIKAEIDMLNEERFDDLQMKAIAEMERLLDDTELSTEAKIKLIKEVLDRHPKGKYVKAQKNKIENSSSVTSETIMELKRLSMRAAAEVIDITPIPAAPQQSVSPAPGADSIPPTPTAESAPSPMEEACP